MRRYSPMTVKMKKGFKAMTSTKRKNARPNAINAQPIPQFLSSLIVVVVPPPPPSSQKRKKFKGHKKKTKKN